jgi:hypothetical protein
MVKKSLRLMIYLQGPPFQQSSASAIEYMDSYKENEKCKEGAKIQSCTVIA